MGVCPDINSWGQVLIGSPLVYGEIGSLGISRPALKLTWKSSDKKKIDFCYGFYYCDALMDFKLLTFSVGVI